MLPSQLPFIDAKILDTLFLANGGQGGRTVEFRENDSIFVQGEAANTIFYLQKGKVKLSVVSQQGKEAIIGLLAPGDFFGEGSIAGQPLRMSTALALTDCTVVRIEKKAMLQALQQQHAFSNLFVAHLLARSMRYEEDLVDQLFNSSEKRLARVLQSLARFGKEGKPEPVIPAITQETLAEMVGTTRSRVNYFLNRFRNLGFIDYDGESIKLLRFPFILPSTGQSQPSSKDQSSAYSERDGIARGTVSGQPPATAKRKPSRTRKLP